jgi:putative transposase
MAVSFKGAHFPEDIILTGVRWYVAYPLSTRHVEELMRERGVYVDHSTINRWVVKYSPQLAEAFHRRKRSVGRSWRMDETYIKVKGQWSYLYRAVDKSGQTIDFLLTEQRDERAAKRFLTQAIRRHGVPEKITIDGSEANEAAIKSYNQEHGTSIEIRQLKYLNNIIEQDHRGVKRVTRPMLGFKSFEAAQSTLVGIELMQLLRKGQLVDGGEKGGSRSKRAKNAKVIPGWRSKGILRVISPKCGGEWRPYPSPITDEGNARFWDEHECFSNSVRQFFILVDFTEKC